MRGTGMHELRSVSTLASGRGSSETLKPLLPLRAFAETQPSAQPDTTGLTIFARDPEAEKGARGARRERLAQKPVSVWSVGGGRRWPPPRTEPAHCARLRAPWLRHFQQQRPSSRGRPRRASRTPQRPGSPPPARRRGVHEPPAARRAASSHGTRARAPRLPPALRPRAIYTRASTGGPARCAPQPCEQRVHERRLCDAAYLTRAMASISTRAASGRSFTAKVARAGGSSGKSAAREGEVVP